MTETKVDTEKPETEEGQTDNNVTVPIHLQDKSEIVPQDIRNENVQETIQLESDKHILDKNRLVKREEEAVKNVAHLHKPINGDIVCSKLPPLEDPSIILLSPNQPRKSSTEANKTEKMKQAIPADDEIETLADEVKHIKEDRATEFLKEELKAEMRKGVSGEST